MDEKGGTAKVTIADVMQSNGVILVVDKVLMPNQVASIQGRNPGLCATTPLRSCSHIRRSRPKQ